MKNPIRVIQVDDDLVYQEQLATALTDDLSLEWLGSFESVEAALRHLEQTVALVLPDLLVLGLALPDQDLEMAIQNFKELSADLKIVVCSKSAEEAGLRRAVGMGASGYFLKSSSMEQMRWGIGAVLAGGACWDNALLPSLMEEMRNHSRSEGEETLLSPREQEVLELLAQGFQKKEIGDKLDLSYFTVDAHVRHIYGKLDVQNAPAAVAQAYRMGILC